MRSKLTLSGLLAVALMCSLAVAACGGASPTSTTGNDGTSASANAVKFANCMRSHGVPDFPDASNGPTRIQASANGGSGSINVDGHTLQETLSEFNRAQTECNKYSPQNNAPPISTAQLAKIKAAALRMAACMRSHGVPDFPDPTVQTGPGGKGVSIGINAGGPNGGGGLNPQSPAFQSAQKACQPIMLAAMPGKARAEKG
jgi:hypothetical protein